MKVIKISVLAFSIGLMSFSNFSKNANIKSSTSIESKGIIWEKDVIDLGQIQHNVPKSIEFVFKNNHNTKVLITDVKASCGCTATNYTKTAIEFGKSGNVTAVFNAATKGVFSKTITVTVNSEQSPKTLTFKGTVL